jgi:diguanylate cyclase (GGDEF)-like protein
MGRRQRPLLLALVYGASVSLALLSLIPVVWLAGEGVSAAAIRSTVSADQELVPQMLGPAMAIDPTTGRAALDPSRIDRSGLEEFAAAHGNAGIAVLATDGRLLAGQRLPAPGSVLMEDLARSANGETRASLVDLSFDDQVPRTTLVEHLPVIVDDRLVAVVRITRDGRQIAADVEATRAQILAVAAVGAAILAAILLLVFRTADRRIKVQGERLAESGRRDPLTGLLNHGAVVERLIQLIESGRPANLGVGIALVDVDNFRLLNETYGHSEGDFVLAELAHELAMEGGAWAAIGRYGPDEFLVVAPSDSARQLEPTIERLRQRLAETTLAFGSSDRLPVSISVGVAHFPWHAQSATDLLSAATVALGEAKSGGGGGVQTAGAWDDTARPGQGPFDVFRGLVIAVDTKDRYTRRHSEDVATYAVFLAGHMDLDETLIETIRAAGLLHDIGKIGIPDDILRKPGELTAHEYDIVKQHVVLGDLIVRDLPASRIIRAGIRHHHERWDGKGYVDGLSGEAIPLVARMLAVADAFSAMTTTRPYRKAMSVEEAMRRLQDAAGTQLDATLVSAFVNAMEASPEAPMPGEDSNRARIWTPHTPAAA